MDLVPKLGVGLNYQPALRPFIETVGDSFDFLEVIPDILWTDRGPGQSPRYIEDPSGIALLREVRTRKQIIPHSIGLSIGSAHRWNRDHIDQLARWHEWLQFPWHSDHLSYHLAEHGAAEMNVGLTVPLPRDHETIAFLTPRIAEVRSRVPAPFLLENNVYFFELADQEMDEPSFLNALCQASGCRLLLDLHNVYVNSRNHGIDPFAFLERLDLGLVHELHVAGGMEYGDFYLDAHSGPLPPHVWEILDWVLPRCPNVGGVVFELLGSWFVEMGAGRLREELGQLKEVWARRRPGARGGSS